jgi:mono/diheme cytochrome c family protein
MIARRVCCCLTVIAAAALLSSAGEAHKAITSKYTYNTDVFPIFRDRCASCHVENGVAPMSLTTFKDAYPWAESIRAELVSGHMPPWNADEGFGRLRNARTLGARELDVVLTWATGGNPQGDVDQALPPVTLNNDWSQGPPDVVLPMAAEFTVPADTLESTQEFTLRTGLGENRWIRAVDLLPGTPKIVRSAVVYVKGHEAGPRSGAIAPDTVLREWLPGHDADPTDARTAFQLPAGADLGLRIHYKKTWQFEGQAISDRSRVGLYFARGNDVEQVQAMTLTAPSAAANGGQTIAFNRNVDADIRVVAIRPEQLPPNISVQVEAVRPDGSRAPIIRLNTRSDWSRRYWLEHPIDLPRGSRIEAAASLANPDILADAFAIAPSRPAPASQPIELVVNVTGTK